MFAPAGRITARAGLRSKLAAIVLAAKRSPLRTPKVWSKNPKAKKCRNDCIFLNAFVSFSRLTPSGPKFLCSHTVGADACHRPAGAGACLRGDASIAPYIPFTDGTVGRGLDPSYAVCNDGNIYHLLHNKKSYVGGGVPDAPDGAYVIACGGQDPSLRTDGK